MTNLQPGQQIGPYQIINQIGRGGMATVYKAHHAAMERYVALKVISAQLAEDPTFLQRFQQEARLIARLEHPHILPVHDYGEADGIPYMVMRYLEAGTLKERLTAGELSLPEIDRIFTQLADALSYAHENGVIHRDIKPSNAMLDKRGDVFLTDFGIAKLVEGTVGMTATGAITGTPAYMSPEQAQGVKVDARSDIYSLGIVLFEMLTGRVPFEAETPLAVIYKQIQDSPPPLSIVKPGLPDVIESVLLKALAKNPADRYSSVHEFLEAWKRAYSAMESPAAPTLLKQPVSPPASPAPRLNWKAIGIGCGVVGVFIVLAVVVAILIFYPRKQTTSIQGPESPVTVTQPATTSTSTVPEMLPSPEKATSWSAGNNISVIVPMGDVVYTSGGGGMVIWDTTNGKPTQLTTRDGIPDSWTPALYRDPLDDSLWLGSSSGLAHIVDGKVVRVFTDSDGLDSPSISAVTRLDEQTLLVGTYYCGYNGCGLMTFDGTSFKALDGFPSAATPSEGQVDYNIYALLVDGDKQIWVATGNGVALLDNDNDWNIFDTTTGLTNNLVYTLMQDSQGDIWAGTASGGVDVFNGDAWSFTEKFNLTERGISDVLSIDEDSQGNYWFSGYAVIRYNSNDDTWTTFSSEDGGLSVWGSTVLTIDDKDVVYVGSYEGLLRYTGKGFDHWYIPNTVNSTSYGRIVAGGDGRLYVASRYSNNSDIFNPADGTWNWNTHSADEASPMATDSAGNVWYGGSNGLWIYADNKTTHVTTEHGLPDNHVNAIAVKPDGVGYLATDNGLAVFDGKKIARIYNTSDMGLDSRLTTLLLTSDGALWVADEKGGAMARLNPNGSWDTFKVNELFGIDPAFITDFAETSEGALLVSTSGNGLYRLEQGKWSRIISADPGVMLTNDYIDCITVAPDGALWFGLWNGSAARFDGENWSRYDLQDGLINRTVHDIYVTPSGEVWFATEGGVTRLES